MGGLEFHPRRTFPPPSFSPREGLPLSLVFRSSRLPHCSFPRSTSSCPSTVESTGRLAALRFISPIPSHSLARQQLVNGFRAKAPLGMSSFCLRSGKTEGLMRRIVLAVLMLAALAGSYWACNSDAPAPTPPTINPTPGASPLLIL